MRNGSVASSFMVITLSRFSGQETSECNGSAGSPRYGFMKVKGWRKRIGHLPLLIDLET